MTATIAVPDSSTLATGNNAIRPFQKVNFPEAELTELRRRIKATRWPERETVTDATQGVQLATTQALASYWATEYDWRKCEARLNAYPQFITEIDGLDIHFIHVRSKHENALPVIVTHGWPGSVVEQMKIIDPLTNPTAHSGSAADAFDVVVPSMPGYGFSGKPTGPGWDPDHIARAWVTLMKRLGYTKFVAQGGDWGAVIVDMMGVQAPPELLAIHTNMAGIFPGEIDQAAFSGKPMPSGLSADEKIAYERLQFVYQKGIAYGFQMGLRPQTLYGIADSPVGLAAYFLDHDARSYALISRVFQGEAEGLTRDDILDNITITWLTNTALSGARLYWEYWGKGYFNAKGVTIPVAVSVFPDELYPAPRSWAEKAYPKLIHYNKLPKGGHFAAWEQPKLFSEELRAGFRSVRSGAVKSAACVVVFFPGSVKEGTTATLTDFQTTAGGLEMEDTTIVESSFSATINAPIETVDIPSWCFTLPESEYQACSPAHCSAGATTSPDGKRMSINVEIIGGSLIVQHYVEEIAEPHHLKLNSNSDIFTSSGRSKVRVIWDLNVKRIDDKTCEFTNTVQDSATPELLDFLGKQGIPWEVFKTGRKPIVEAHNRQETPLFAKSIERYALTNNRAADVASAA